MWELHYSISHLKKNLLIIVAGYFLELFITFHWKFSEFHFFFLVKKNCNIFLRDWFWFDLMCWTISKLEKPRHLRQKLQKKTICGILAVKITNPIINTNGANGLSCRWCRVEKVSAHFFTISTDMRFNFSETMHF